MNQDARTCKILADVRSFEDRLAIAKIISDRPANRSRSRSASMLLAIGKQLARRDDALPRGLIRRIAFRSDKLSRRGPEGPESEKEAEERGGRCSRYLPDSVFSYVKDARSARGRSGRSRARDD